MQPQRVLRIAVILTILTLPLSMLRAEECSVLDSGARRSVFDRGGGCSELSALVVEETLKLPGRTMSYPSVSYSQLMAGRRGGAGGSRTKNIAISVTLSALLPGLGETYLYTRDRKISTLIRAPIFFAVEAYLWYGYYTNHKEGKDIKQQYMAYADEHWSEERFLEQHPCCEGYGGCDDWQYYNENCRDDAEFFLYTPKELDEEEYYENLGKYDPFVYGWDDWEEWSQTGDGTKWTPHRTEYWALRTESDDYLVTGDEYLMGLIITRVVSMIDCAYLAYTMDYSDTNEPGWSLQIDSGLVSAQVALCYRF